MALNAQFFILVFSYDITESKYPLYGHLRHTGLWAAQPKSSVVQTVCFCRTANEKKAYLKRQEKEPQQTVFMAMLQTPLLSG